MKLRALALVAAVSLAACSGGAGAPSNTPPIPAPTVTPGGTNPTAALTLSFQPNASHSSTGKKPAYVSPSSTQITVAVNTVNGGAPPSWVTTPVTTALTVGTNCTLSGGTETCTVSVPAPVGTVNYTFAVGDGTNVLSTWTGDQTVVQGIANSFGVTLRGNAATVTVSGSALAANANIGSETLTVHAFDTDSNLIVSPGAYNHPITLTDDDATGVTTLSVNGGTGASSVVVSSPADVVTLNYNGQAVNGFSIAASGTGITGGGTISSTVDDVTFPSGTTLDDAGHGGLVTDPNWGQQTVFFAQGSGTQVITAAELGFTNSPYNRSFDVSLSAGCTSGNIGSVSAGPATSFTITASGSPGICSGRLTEHGTGYPLTGHPASSSGNATQDGTFWISVTTSSFGVNHTKL